MRVLFINKDLGVKQFHLACSLTDQHKADCYFMSLYPQGLNWRSVGIGKPKKLLRQLLRNRAFSANAVKKDPLNPFKEIQGFNQGKIEEFDPDLIYVSSNVIDVINPDFTIRNIFLDVEDSVAFHQDILPPEKIRMRMIHENRWIFHKNVKMIGYGSVTERDEALKRLHPKKPFITVYPLVARRTIPPLQNKTTEFSVVYAGSIWLGNSYRNYYDSFSAILKKGIPLVVFCSNSFNPHVWRTYSKLRKYPHFKLMKFSSFGTIKKEISSYHVGLSGNPRDFMKLKATFGMKPLEYAYANVQPASLRSSLRNLSNGKEFGYCCSTHTIQENWKDNLQNFDFDRHLMDHHLGELIECS